MSAAIRTARRNLSAQNLPTTSCGDSVRNEIDGGEAHPFLETERLVQASRDGVIRFKHQARPQPVAQYVAAELGNGGSGEAVLSPGWIGHDAHDHGKAAAFSNGVAGSDRLA